MIKAATCLGFTGQRVYSQARLRSYRRGNMDVISSHQAGVTNVVATAGTAMTSMHLKTLSRLTSKIKLAFDNDSAGLAATERAIELAKELDIDLFIVFLLKGAKDPDELRIPRRCYTLAKCHEK